MTHFLLVGLVIVINRNFPGTCTRQNNLIELFCCYSVKNCDIYSSLGVESHATETGGLRGGLFG